MGKQSKELVLSRQQQLETFTECLLRTNHIGEALRSIGYSDNAARRGWSTVPQWLKQAYHQVASAKLEEMGKTYQSNPRKGR